MVVGYVAGTCAHVHGAATSPLCGLLLGFDDMYKINREEKLHCICNICHLSSDACRCAYDMCLQLSHRFRCLLSQPRGRLKDGRLHVTHAQLQAGNEAPYLSVTKPLSLDNESR